VVDRQKRLIKIEILNKILKKVKVPKGSFYHYFASKEAFGQAVIDNYAKYFANKLDTCLLDESYPALKRISNFVEDAKIGMIRHNFKRGCLVGNLGQEVDLLPESYREQLVDILHSWQHRVAQCLTIAKTEDQLSAAADCELLAEFFWVGWEGAVSRSKLVQSTQPLDNYFNCFISSLPR